MTSGPRASFRSTARSVSARMRSRSARRGRSAWSSSCASPSPSPSTWSARRGTARHASAPRGFARLWRATRLKSKGRRRLSRAERSEDDEEATSASSERTDGAAGGVGGEARRVRRSLRVRFGGGARRGGAEASAMTGEGPLRSREGEPVATARHCEGVVHAGPAGNTVHRGRCAGVGSGRGAVASRRGATPGGWRDWVVRPGRCRDGARCPRRGARGGTPGGDARDLGGAGGVHQERAAVRLAHHREGGSRARSATEDEGACGGVMTSRGTLARRDKTGCLGGGGGGRIRRGRGRARTASSSPRDSTEIVCTLLVAPMRPRSSGGVRCVPGRHRAWLKNRASAESSTRFRANAADDCDPNISPLAFTDPIMRMMDYFRDRSSAHRRVRRPTSDGGSNFVRGSSRSPSHLSPLGPPPAPEPARAPPAAADCRNDPAYG